MRYPQPEVFAADPVRQHLAPPVFVRDVMAAPLVVDVLGALALAYRDDIFLNNHPVRRCRVHGTVTAVAVHDAVPGKEFAVLQVCDGTTQAGIGVLVEADSANVLHKTVEVTGDVCLRRDTRELRAVDWQVVGERGDLRLEGQAVRERLAFREHHIAPAWDIPARPTVVYDSITIMLDDDDVPPISIIPALTALVWWWWARNQPRHSLRQVLQAPQISSALSPPGSRTCFKTACGLLVSMGLLARVSRDVYDGTELIRFTQWLHTQVAAAEDTVRARELAREYPRAAVHPELVFSLVGRVLAGTPATRRHEGTRQTLEWKLA